MFQVLDMRAFSSLWYWLLLGLVWTRVMQAPLGVPVEMLRAARRGPGQARSDALALARIEARHRMGALRALGAWRVAGWYCLLSALAVLAIGHAMEAAQATLLIAAPIGVVRWLGARAAARVAEGDADEEARLAALARLRWQVQAVGLVSVFLSAVFGMVHNLVSGVLP